MTIEKWVAEALADRASDELSKALLAAQLHRWLNTREPPYLSSAQAEFTVIVEQIRSFPKTSNAFNHEAFKLWRTFHADDNTPAARWFLLEEKSRAKWAALTEKVVAVPAAKPDMIKREGPINYTESLAAFIRDAMLKQGITLSAERAKDFAVKVMDSNDTMYSGPIKYGDSRDFIGAWARCAEFVHAEKRRLLQSAKGRAQPCYIFTEPAKPPMSFVDMAAMLRYMGLPTEPPKTFAERQLDRIREMPPIIRAMSQDSLAWIVGSRAEFRPEKLRVNKDSDWDVMVPFSEWQDAMTRLAAAGALECATHTSVGGIRTVIPAKNGGTVKLDIWPGEISSHMMKPFTNVAWQPKTGAVWVRQH